jgi:hypothetical protein
LPQQQPQQHQRQGTVVRPWVTMVVTKKKKNVAVVVATTTRGLWSWFAFHSFWKKKYPT